MRRSATKIVIVGAGYAGLSAADALVDRLGPSTPSTGERAGPVDVRLIDMNPFQTLKPKLPRVAAGAIDPAGASVDIAGAYRNTPVEVTRDIVEAVDVRRGVLWSETDRYHYDYLILAGGSAPRFYGIPGVAEHAFPLVTLDDALRIRTHLNGALARAADRQKAGRGRAGELHFVVCGGGRTGVELASAFGRELTRQAGEYGIDPRTIGVTLLERKERILPSEEAKAAERMTAMLERAGVRIRTGADIHSVDKEGVVLGEDSLEASTVIWTAGIGAAPLTRRVPLTKLAGSSPKGKSKSGVTGPPRTGETAAVSSDGVFSWAQAFPGLFEEGPVGRLVTDRFMRSVNVENVFVAGDMMIQPVNGQPPPRTIDIARKTGAVAGTNVAAQLLSEEPQPCDCGMTAER